jgi:hypothetical protein
MNNPTISYIPFYEDDTKVFSSYDLGASSALSALGYKLLKIDKGQGSKSLFLFESSEELIESAQMYWRGELQVDALTYFNAIKTIKNQLYSN